MGRGFGEMMQALSALLPPEMLAVVAGVVLVIAAPFWFNSMRGKQIHGAVRRRVRAEGPEREALAERAMTLAAGRPTRLVSLVQHAIKYGQNDLRDRALAALEATGKAEADVKHLRARIHKPPIQHRDPLEAVVRIQGLLDQGLVVAAQENVEAAVRRFPDDPDVARLAEQVRDQTAAS